MVVLGEGGLVLMGEVPLWANATCNCAIRSPQGAPCMKIFAFASQ